MTPNRSRWATVARAVGRVVWRGFAHYGAVMAYTVPYQWWPHSRSPVRLTPETVPPGHPESLAAHIPPTAAEHDLWRRLGHPARRD